MSISILIVAYSGSAATATPAMAATANAKEAERRLFILFSSSRRAAGRVARADGVAKRPILQRPALAARGSAFCRDLPQRLLENRTRLPARDQVLAVDDDGRHGMDADLLPK